MHPQLAITTTFFKENNRLPKAKDIVYYEKIRYVFRSSTWRSTHRIYFTIEINVIDCEAMMTSVSEEFIKSKFPNAKFQNCTILRLQKLLESGVCKQSEFARLSGINPVYLSKLVNNRLPLTNRMEEQIQSGMECFEEQE